MGTKASHRIWLGLALIVAFMLGAAMRQLLLVADLNPAPQTPVTPVQIRVQTPDDVVRTRDGLIRHLFGSPSLPASLPVDNGDGTYVVSMQPGLASVVELHRPDVSNGRLILYHAGHDPIGTLDRSHVDELVEDGNTVLVFDMPLIGVNAGAFPLDLPNGPVTISRHDHLAYVEPDAGGSPIRFFMEPVIVMLNEFAPEFEDISMIGISGGGWTTTLAAAIDTRIDRSYQAAGTLPMAVRFSREDSWGDFEQHEPSLYAIADYQDMYVLGASDRRQMQILNEHDPCCFGGDYRSVYEPQVQAALEATGGGSFSVFLDTENTEHSISPAAMRAIELDIESHPAVD